MRAVSMELIEKLPYVLNTRVRVMVHSLPLIEEDKDLDLYQRNHDHSWLKVSKRQLADCEVSQSDFLMIVHLGIKDVWERAVEIWIVSIEFSFWVNVCLEESHLGLNFSVHLVSEEVEPRIVAELLPPRIFALANVLIRELLKHLG